MIITKDVIEFCNDYKGRLFHALLTDPPYHLDNGFMNQSWDASGISFQKETWQTIGRVLYPGAYGMAFASAKGYHRLAAAIEDAGFIIHPSIFAWVKTNGFPKATRIPSKDFEGHRYGTQVLAPTVEPIIVFQKPWAGKRINSILSFGTGTINIKNGRIPSPPYTINRWTDGAKPFGDASGEDYFSVDHFEGRWPKNFVVSEEASKQLPNYFFVFPNDVDPVFVLNKATNKEKDAGLDSFETKKIGMSNAAQMHGENYKLAQDSKTVGLNRVIERKNTHPTVKPLALAKYLASILLPPEKYSPRGLFVPFCGSGSEVIGGYQAGWEYVCGIDNNEEYAKIAKARLNYWLGKEDSV